MWLVKLVWVWVCPPSLVVLWWLLFLVWWGKRRCRKKVTLSDWRQPCRILRREAKEKHPGLHVVETKTQAHPQSPKNRGEGRTRRDRGFFVGSTPGVQGGGGVVGVVGPGSPGQKEKTKQLKLEHDMCAKTSPGQRWSMRVGW